MEQNYELEENGFKYVWTLASDGEDYRGAVLNNDTMVARVGTLSIEGVATLIEINELWLLHRGILRSL